MTSSLTHTLSGESRADRDQGAPSSLASPPLRPLLDSAAPTHSLADEHKERIRSAGASGGAHSENQAQSHRVYIGQTVEMRHARQGSAVETVWNGVFLPRCDIRSSPPFSSQHAYDLFRPTSSARSDETEWDKINRFPLLFSFFSFC